MTSPRFILASASSRRRGLLLEAGYTPLIHPMDLDERSFESPGLLPADLAARLSAAKAAAAAALFPGDVILAADTVVALGDCALGKPPDAAAARAMLARLAGTTHQVITSVTVLHPNAAHRADATVISTVRMRPVTPDQIRAYVATGDWRGKAGGYGIQDNDTFVERLTGCLTNIVGLPMTTVTRLLTQAGVEKQKR